MGLEIQGAVNSMIGSVGSVIQQNEANKKKALNIALGAATGGIGGAVTAAAKQAGIDSKAVGRLTGTKTDLTGDVVGGQQMASPQTQAANMADQSAYNEIEAKKAQRARIDALQTNFGGNVGDLPEAIKKKIYEEYNK